MLRGWLRVSKRGGGFGGGRGFGGGGRRFSGIFVAIALISLSCGACAGSPTQRGSDSGLGSLGGEESSDSAGRGSGSSAVGSSEERAFVTWCASGGAPIVGLPVVDEQERVYVATTDGYLHAFERDGRFRWSYTVKGTPLGSVSLRPSDGVILLGTTARYVYAINQSGSLHWSFRPLTPVWSGLFALNQSTVVFVGQDRRLYALKNRTGGARYRVRAPGEPMGGPVVAADNVVWLALADGVARFQSARKLEKFLLPSATEQLVVVGSRAVARAFGRAFLIAPDADPVELGEARFLASDGERLVTVSEDAKILLYDKAFEVLPMVLRDPLAHPEEGELRLSAPPVLKEERLWLPYEDGSLEVLSLGGKPSLSVIVGDRPLSTPVVGASEKWALVSDHEGTFCAVEFPSR